MNHKENIGLISTYYHKYIKSNFQIIIFKKDLVVRESCPTNSLPAHKVYSSIGRAGREELEGVPGIARLNPPIHALRQTSIFPILGFLHRRIWGFPVLRIPITGLTIQ